MTTNHIAPDDPSHDYYRVEFATRAYLHPDVAALNVCAHEAAAVVRFDDRSTARVVHAVLSDVLAPAENEGVRVTCDLDAVDLLQTDPTVAKVGLVTD